MKMAKASEKDIDAAGKLCQLLNLLDEGNRWSCGALGDTADFFEIADEFDPEKSEHLESLYDKLMLLMHAQPSFHNRVIGGMCYVIMYDTNEIVDPDSDCLDLHPRFYEAFDDLQRETQAARYWNMRYHQLVEAKAEWPAFRDMVKQRDQLQEDLAREQRITLAMATSLGNAVAILGGEEHDLVEDVAAEVVRQRDGLLDALRQIERARAPDVGSDREAIHYFAAKTLGEFSPEEKLPGGQYYAEDGTLMNADGTRSIFDDVDE